MTYARLRFLTAITVIGGGVLLGLGAVIFAAGTERWLGLGVGSGLAAFTILASLTSGRGGIQRLLDGLLVPICLWALISARTIELPGHGATDSLVKWLGLSAGAGIFAVGLLALLAHELAMEADLAWAGRELTGAEPPARGVPSAPPEPATAEASPESDDEPTAEPTESEAAAPEAEPTDPETNAPEAEPTDPETNAPEAEPAEPESATPEAEPETASGADDEPSQNGHATANGAGGTWLTPIEDDEESRTSTEGAEA